MVVCDRLVFFLDYNVSNKGDAKETWSRMNEKETTGKHPSLHISLSILLLATNTQYSPTLVVGL